MSKNISIQKHILILIGLAIATTTSAADSEQSVTNVVGKKVKRVVFFFPDKNPKILNLNRFESHLLTFHLPFPT